MLISPWFIHLPQRPFKWRGATQTTLWAVFHWPNTNVIFMSFSSHFSLSLSLSLHLISNSLFVITRLVSIEGGKSGGSSERRLSRWFWPMLHISGLLQRQKVSFYGAWWTDLGLEICNTLFAWLQYQLSEKWTLLKNMLSIRPYIDFFNYC